MKTIQKIDKCDFCNNKATYFGIETHQFWMSSKVNLEWHLYCSKHRPLEAKE